MAKVITSHRGGKLLVYKGYSYHLHKNGSDKKIWLCSDSRRNKCLGRLHSADLIPEDGELVEVLHESCNHNHTPDAAHVEKVAVVNKVKTSAGVSTESTASIVASAIQGASTACLGTGRMQPQQ